VCRRAQRVTMSFDPIRAQPVRPWMPACCTHSAGQGLTVTVKNGCFELGAAINSGSNESIRLSPYPVHKIKADVRYRDRTKAIKRHTAKMSLLAPPTAKSVAPLPCSHYYGCTKLDFSRVKWSYFLNFLVLTLQAAVLLSSGLITITLYYQ
jgi:hypothetical protein